MRDLSYAALKETGAVPHWFGLGFVQLKLNQKQRMHFWHPEHHKNVADEEVHNHRYSFTSKIIVGEMIHETWTYEQNENGDAECIEVCCKPGHSGEPKIVSRGFMTMSGRYAMPAGSSYYFPSSGFHRTITEKAVTFLCRGEIEGDFAKVLKPINTATVCPFSVQKSEAECWEIIKELLSDK